MKFILLLLGILLISGNAAEQSELLPKRMLFTQRMFWGEQGIMRKSDLVPLNRENRFKELEIREKLFVGHKILGFVTLAEMLGAGIVGWQVAEGNHDLAKAHEVLVVGTNVTYFTGLSLALFSPPPKTNKAGAGVTIHKILSTVHLAGMITTDLLGDQTAKKDPQAHKISGIATFSTLALATVVVQF